MSTASNSRVSSTVSKAAGDATASMSKPSPLSSKRSASRMSGWSSATRTRERCESENVIRYLSFAIESLSGSFIAQGHERVHLCGAPRRNIAGEKCDGRKHCDYDDEYERVRGFDAVELPGEEPRGRNGPGEANNQTNEREKHSLSHNHPENIERASAERHADADFVRALRNRVSHHAVDPDGGEDQRQCRKYTHQRHEKRIERERRGQYLIHRAHFSDGQVGINFAHRVRHGLADSQWVLAGTDNDRGGKPSLEKLIGRTPGLCNRNENCGWNILSHFGFHIANDSDNFPCGIGILQMLPNGAAI